MDSISQSKQALQTLLQESSSIGIVVSEHQTIDVLAAALSLHLIFQDSGKNSQIVSKKDPIVEHSFLVGIDQLAKGFTGSTKTLTVSFPYHDGDIEKVSYNIEGDRLNVNLFAEEQGIRFTEKDIRYIREGSSPQLIFTVGISKQEELQGIVDQGAKIVNIDNSVANPLYGTIPLVDPSHSSLSEIVAKLAFDQGLQIEFDVAQNLVDGISFATQNFVSPKTSALAFEMVGALMQRGAVRKNGNNNRPTTDTSLSMLGQNKQQKPFTGNSNGQLSKPQNNQQFSNNNQQHAGSQQQFSQPISDMRFQDQQPFEDQFVQDAPQSSQQPVPFTKYSQPQQQPQQEMAPDMNTEEQAPEIPSEDEAPSDWFTPKVFKSNKNQG